VRFWRAMVSDPVESFEVEETVVCGDRATNRWRYRFGEGDSNWAQLLMRILRECSMCGSTNIGWR
jgi:hypothetical protein